MGLMPLVILCAANVHQPVFGWQSPRADDASGLMMLPSLAKRKIRYRTNHAAPALSAAYHMDVKPDAYATVLIADSNWLTFIRELNELGARKL
jgi:hypothetical protein